MEKIGKKLKAHEESLNKNIEVAAEEVRAGSGSSFMRLIEKHQKNLLIGGIAVVVLIVAFFGFNIFRNRNNDKAQEEMFQAVQYFEQGQMDMALSGDSLNAKGFEEIISRYGGTDAGNQARFYAGVAAIEKGDRATGIQYLEKMKKGNGMLAMSAYMALGFAYEDEGNFNKAAANFESAASAIDENEHTTPTLLFHAGRNHEAAGNAKKALALYKRIKSEYPDSQEGASIDKYIGRATP